MSAERTVFYTRLGIGVFDPLWWQYRLRLFRAVTLPSLARFCRDGSRWAIVIDEDLPREAHQQLADLIEAAGIKDNVTFLPVQFWPDMFAALEQFIIDTFGTGHVALVRIDDDDALASDFLDRAESYLPSAPPPEPVVATLASGWEASLADRKIRPLTMPFGSMNNVFWGPVRATRAFTSVGHHKIAAWVERVGGRAVVVDDGPAAYLYSRHKHADSSYPTHRARILNDPVTRNMTQKVYADFGVDLQALDEWRTFAASAPSIPPKTWDITAGLVQKALGIQGQLREVEAELHQLTTHHPAE